MKKIIRLSIILLVPGICCISAQNDSTNTRTKNKAKTNASAKAGMTVITDDQFAKEATMGGKKEVEMATMAQSKASDQRVKNYADMLVRDHTAANAELKSIIQRQNIQVNDNEMGKNTSINKTGDEFDKEFIQMMVSDHKKTINLFESESKNGKVNELKEFAEKTLPTLRMHLDSATTIQSYLKNKHTNMGELINK